MRNDAAFMLRNSTRKRVYGTLTLLVLLSGILLFCARPALADDKSPDQSLVKVWRSILGPVEVHLVFTDADGKQQDYSLAEAPPEFVKKLTPRLQAESKFPLLQPKIRYFDGLWLAKNAAVCKEAVADTQQTYPAGGTNTAYDVTCRPFKVGTISAYIEPNAPAYFKKYNNMGAEVIPAGGYPTGHVWQLQLEFGVPAVNVIRYTLTTPCTCHDQHNVLGVVVCNKDPDFTSFFDVSVIVRTNSTEVNSMKFGPRPQMQSGYLAMQTALVLKDGKAIEQQIAGLESTLERQLEIDVASLATDEFSFGVVIYQFLEDLFKYGIGGLFEMSCNGQMFHNLSIDPSGGATYNLATVQQMTKTVSQAFKTLFLALDSASKLGFTSLDVVKGPQSSLIFKLTYPAPGKTEPTNGIAAENAAQKKGIQLVTASIGTPTQQVKAGFPVMVRGNNFTKPYVNALDISWGKTVAGIADTQLEWGPKGGAMQKVDVKFATSYHAANLKPSTAYQFRVHECDQIACAPLSGWFTTSTEGGGSGEVTLWLDNNAGQPIGTGTLLPNGSFNAKVTIPANTTAGTHTINASSGVAAATGPAGRRSLSNPSSTGGMAPNASVQITVIGQTGLRAAGGTGAGLAGGNPSISVMNTQTRTALKPPINLLYPSTFRLRGNGFAPAVTVTVHLDTATGPQLGTAITNKIGIFAGNFKIPMTQSGLHTLVAVQVANGRTLQASEAVQLASQPK